MSPAPDELLQVLQSPQALAFAVALAVALFLAALLKLWLGGPKGNAVLLVGPCDAGKTTLFHQLTHGGGQAGTVASMQENVAEGPLASEKGGAVRPVQLVDIPGHPRLRGAGFDAHVERARGIVFVVDSVDFMPRKTEAAEQLFEVLAHPAVMRRRLPLLLACNKTDAGSKAHTVDFIRKRLEKELDQMRSTRGALADSGSGKQQAAAGVQLGAASEPFSFEAHAKAQGVRVTTASSSALDTGGAAEVAAFIRRCVPA